MLKVVFSNYLTVLWSNVSLLSTSLEFFYHYYSFAAIDIYKQFVGSACDSAF